MHENFPRKYPGDSISARHINDLGSVLARVGRLGGVGQDVRQNSSALSVSAALPWQQEIFIITNTKINATDADDSGLYLAKMRWYSFDDEEWKTNDGQEYEIDTTECENEYKVNDKLVAYFDEKRGMWVSVGTGRGRHFELD